jgi:hypothetical protein
LIATGVAVVVVFVVLSVWLLQRQSAHTPEAAPAGAPADLLAQLTVAVEDTGAHYNRADWGDWVGQGNSCDTRALVLQHQGASVDSRAGCKVAGGLWTSPYDGVVVTNPRELDIDHIVPVKEANRSGARNWSPELRATFYNDSANLVAVSASSNRAKGDSDPAHWRPVRTYWCVYATSYAGVKVHYHLAVDLDEKAALSQMLGTC